MSEENTQKSSTTLEDVKMYLRQNYDAGCICPACNQHVKLYKRQLSSTMAYCMIMFVKHVRNNQMYGFIDFNKILNDLKLTPAQRADWQKLAYFKLITPETTTKGDPKSGFYRIHENGFDFVEKGLNIPKHCNVYNGKVMGYSIEQTDIKKALKNKFNYEDLMNM